MAFCIDIIFFSFFFFRFQKFLNYIIIQCFSHISKSPSVQLHNSFLTRRFLCEYASH
ncbi:hypothetical protein OnM2_c708o8 [Erysiphe neolycopersici]|uniref:Uncharacterized protein n=1 Tax=Erysiphe neolycopersici TaxID=212602 RepID=A0A420HHA6_9PEZI|nr:hypothetical protein OnM2_c708o8 [Erysiphe neolycopersici]